jgi:hypothetical protein
VICLAKKGFLCTQIHTVCLEISTQPLKKAGANFNSARGDSHGPWQENSQQYSQRTLLKIKSVRILNIPIGVTGILQEPVFLENEGQQMMRVLATA